MKRTCMGWIWGIAMMAVVMGAQGANIWDGGGGNANWDTLGNWDDDAVPSTTADVTFGTAFTSGTTISLNGSRTVNSLTINTATAFAIANNTLTNTTGNITVSVDGNHDLNSAINIGSTAAAWSITGTKDPNGSHGLDLIGQITGNNSITKTGTGTLFLDATSGNPNFTGAMIVTGGELSAGRLHANQLQNASSLSMTNADFFTSYPGSLGTGLVSLDTVTMTFNDSLQTITNTISVANTVTFGGNQPQVISGQISGAGNVAIQGTRYKLSGTNLYSGTTTVKSGAYLEFTSIADVAGGNSALGAPATVANGVLSCIDSTPRYIGTESGGHRSNREFNYGGGLGYLEASGVGALTLNGDPNNGNISIRGTANRMLTLGGTGTGVVNGVLSIGNGSGGGSGGVSLKKIGSGTWIFGGTNSYTGTTFVNVGTLLVNGTHAGAGSYTNASGATLGGTGTISLASGKMIMVSGNSVLSPGVGVGTLTVTGNVTLAEGAVYKWEYQGTARDLVAVNGALTLPNVATVIVSQVSGELPVLSTLFTFTSVSGATILDNWVVQGQNNGRVSVRGNSVILHFGRGTVVMVL